MTTLFDDVWSTRVSVGIQKRVLAWSRETGLAADLPEISLADADMDRGETRVPSAQEG